MLKRSTKPVLFLSSSYARMALQSPNPVVKTSGDVLELVVSQQFTIYSTGVYHGSVSVRMLMEVATSHVLYMASLGLLPNYGPGGEHSILRSKYSTVTI